MHHEKRGQKRKDVSDEFHGGSDYYNSDDESDSDGAQAFDDGDWKPNPKSPKPKRAKAPKAVPKKPKVVKLPAKAEIVNLATDEPVGGKGDSQERLSKIDASVLNRIKKALSLANHVGTGEEEARVALRMASKLMERHNITQAEVLSQQSAEEKLKRYAQFYGSQWGIVQHEIRRMSPRHTDADENKVYNLILTWSLENKEAKGRHGKKYVLKISFILALLVSVTFVVHIAWALPGLIHLAQKEKEEEKKKAIEHEYKLLLERRRQEAAEDARNLARLEDPKTTAVEQLLVEGRSGDAGDVEVKSEDERGHLTEVPPVDKKVKIEEVDDDNGIPPSPPSHIRSSLKKEQNDDTWASVSRMDDVRSKVESDNDDSDDDFSCGGYFSDQEFTKATFCDEDDVDDLMDLDAAVPRVRKRSSASPLPLVFTHSPPPVDNEDDGFDAGDVKCEETTWQSVGQLIAFREDTKAIGDEYLKSQGVKLKRKRDPRFLIRDDNAQRVYKQGKKDAEKIDVKRRRIKGPNDD
ncbi:hypothetical protein FISHEDRAFT_55663 [Fistulina hepatica ATCC 64428]|uniref:DUF2786 domain-containing protein n=1 Tax=Fistulina hepatica ATCC 64428 TaxID=1128425 RepID=A0A0D7AMX7_9AGAR|nr:hypothetical protein FISHEDRAFT_55663 [Fistulina hepatica ATCC 64428]